GRQRYGRRDSLCGTMRKASSTAEGGGTRALPNGCRLDAANPANALAWRETQDAARTLGVALQSHEVKVPKDFEGAFAIMAKERPDALLVLEDLLTTQYRKEIADFAAQQRLPSMFGVR